MALAFTATVGDTYVAVGEAKEDPTKVALVVRDLATDPKGEQQVRTVMTAEAFVALLRVGDLFVESLGPAVEQEDVVE